MKVLTLVGTRPELIRLSIIIDKLDNLAGDHIFVYTNQNYDYNLSGRFFDEMAIRQPDYYLGVNTIGHSFCKFFSVALLEFESILIEEAPDKILILGDTNSGLLSLVAKKYNIPVYHMEAGNRCFDDKVPEEINRRLIDHLSKYNLPYTENSKQNLLNEGFHKNFVFKTGNPILEVLTFYKSEINESEILDTLGIERDFVLVTTHRSENVDNPKSLSNIVNAVNEISGQLPVVFSVHPRTKEKLQKFNLKLSSDNIILNEPFGFFDFVKLEKNARVVISDSGTVQEECCIFGVPSITIRNSTERQETIECGSNILSGVEYNNIIEAFNVLLGRINKWSIPDDYLVINVSDIVINILMGQK